MTVTATAPRAASAVTESPASDLLERLIAAATAAILDQRQSFGYDPARLRGITIELEVANRGQVIDGRCRVERKVKARR